MSSKQRKSKGGRPNVLGADAGYLTVKLRGDQIRFVNRLAGPAPGRKPEAIRQLLDEGIRIARARIARAR